MDFKIVCWERQHVTTLKRQLSRMGIFPQLEKPKPHIFFLTPFPGAEGVVCSILNSHVESGHVLKYVVWDYAFRRGAPDEDLPMEGKHAED